jgi:hypothetical protein
LKSKNEFQLIQSQIPKNQIPKIWIYDKDNISKYVITKDMGNEYILYYIDQKGQAEKLKQSQDPTKLQEYVKQKLAERMI